MATLFFLDGGVLRQQAFLPYRSARCQIVTASACSWRRRLAVAGAIAGGRELVMSAEIEAKAKKSSRSAGNQ